MPRSRELRHPPAALALVPISDQLQPLRVQTGSWVAGGALEGGSPVVSARLAALLQLLLDSTIYKCVHLR